MTSRGPRLTVKHGELKHTFPTQKSFMIKYYKPSDSVPPDFVHSGYYWLYHYTHSGWSLVFRPYFQGCIIASPKQHYDTLVSSYWV